EVVGAIIASTLTTVAVFVPVLTIQEEAGQLFRDISLAIVASVTLSLVVSITVIPAAMSRLMRAKADEHEHGPIRKAIESLFGLAPLLQRLNGYLGDRVYWVMTGWRGWTLRPAVIIVMTAASLIGALMLKPPLDYLPAGNRNLVFGGLLIPPGYSIDQMEQIATRIEGQIKPYVGVEPDDEEALSKLAPIPRRGEGLEPFRPVGVENFFIGSFNGGMFIGGTSMDEQVVLPVGQLLSNSMSSTPDAFGGASQSSLFGRGIGGGNSIDIEIMGPDLDRVVNATGFLFGSLMNDPRFGPMALQPNPSNFSLPQQEFRVRVNTQGRELGIRTDGVGTAVRALFDGAYAGDFRTAGQSIDIRLVPSGGRLENKEQIADIPISTPRGPVVSMDTVVDFEPGLAPQEIRRIEELPAVTLSVTPPDGEPLESVMQDIRENYIAAAEQAGLIDKTMRVRLEGTAAQLDEVTTALFGTGLGGEGADGKRASWQVAADIFGVMLLLAGLGVGVFALAKCVSKRKPAFGYAAAGALVLGTILFTMFYFGIGSNPQLLLGRIVWSVIVVYLLMCALFESFVYPFVIMFSVPLALVGGFAGLAIVHATTAANPYIATQNLDVLTMLGIVILVGVVVNNAILIVHQALNLMRGTGDVDPSELPEGYEPGQPMEPMRAIAESVKTRTRPVFMSTLTSVGGMLPLVLFPGAGSELYRGLGSVVVGGLLVSTIFTLLLVPLVFGLTLQMTDGLRTLFGMQSTAEAQRRDLNREMLGLKPDASKEKLETVGA
ncbi:MAG: efflux RND transporter permease subunit, partial [Phycisphaerales bacterium JB065]